MTLHRFFLSPDCFGPDVVSFPADVSHQLERVLRLSAGERVLALDGTGREYVIQLESLGPLATGVIEQSRINRSEPQAALSLYIGVLKSSRLELVLQKCTEIGVTAFVPILTERCVPAEPSPARRRRFNAIVREAAEQCGRGRIPRVEDPIPLDAAVAQATANGTAVMLWEEERSTRLERLSLPPAMPVSLFIGPEGGFSPAEAHVARVAGAHIVTLGPRILRAETAAIVGSALVLQTMGDM